MEVQWLALSPDRKKDLGLNPAADCTLIRAEFARVSSR